MKFYLCTTNQKKILLTTDCKFLFLEKIAVKNRLVFLKKRTLIYLFVSTIFLPFGEVKRGVAQTLDSAALSNAPTFYSLDEALKNPTQVYKFKMRRKGLEKFPDEVFQFENLQVLDLSKNKISEIPENIKNLKNLQELRLSKNKIQVIPNELCELIFLKKLFLERNKITAIPSQIGNLKKLEIIDLWSNDVVIFPKELSELKNLKTLDLQDNLVNEEERKKLKLLLPDTKIIYTKSCNCGS